MFSGFNLSAITFSESDLEYFYQKGLDHFDKYKTTIETNLRKYICEDGSINGSMMQEDWFPQVSADIFLSHSHKDEKIVIAIAGWLNEAFNLNVFIDSCIWGYAPKLLENIDNNYCISKKEGDHTTYNYQKRNYSTSHVYMMLSIALTKMIDKSESLFFYNTPSSLTIDSTINKNTTNSPWIYHELQTSKVIRHRPLSDYRKKRITKDAYGPILEHAQLDIRYDVTLDHLVNIDAKTLVAWKNAYLTTPCRYPLDKLYSQKNIIDL